MSSDSYDVTLLTNEHNYFKCRLLSNIITIIVCKIQAIILFMRFEMRIIADIIISLLQIRINAYIFRILIQTRLDELFEWFRVTAGELWGVVLGYEEEHPHGMKLRVGRLSLGELDGRDAERPDVRLTVVARLFDHLGRHPERRAYESIPFACRVRQLARDT